ncbi:alpha/beta hydrolase [Microbacterium atlanticum]|uniref:alpha/beta hydrolase n=1 Tax=Microbacterium atlanticum TaxID=2782168 RepID=UPI001889B8FC|nr:alpha/beta hydrolase [Microbacterium atlanticum]
MPEYLAASGVTIFYDVHEAKTPPHAIVQLVHGVGEHSGRYGALIDALTTAGYTVYADDHLGHGRTGMQQWAGDASRLGRPGKGGLQAMIAALATFTELIRDENPDLPLVILGHSLGSYFTQILLNRLPDAYAGVVLSATSLRLLGWTNAGPLNARWAGPDAMGTEWLSSDHAVGRAFLDDPLTTTSTLQQLVGWADSLRLQGLPRRNPGTDVPILLMVGRDDPLGGPRSVHKLADAYRTRSRYTDVTTLVYPGARHEIFNEVVQQDVRADLIAWLDRRFPPRD